MNKRGMTLVEILLVIALIGIMSAYAFPRLGDAMTRQSVRSARVAFVGLYAKARYTAIQRGARASFIVSANTITIQSTNPVTGVAEKVGNVEDLNARYGVTIQPATFTLTFDSRGLGSTGTSVSITKGSFGTTIVISAAGRVIQ